MAGRVQIALADRVQPALRARVLMHRGTGPDIDVAAYELRRGAVDSRTIHIPAGCYVVIEEMQP
jgi:hypothetical protein